MPVPAAVKCPLKRASCRLQMTVEPNPATAVDAPLSSFVRLSEEGAVFEKPEETGHHLEAHEPQPLRGYAPSLAVSPVKPSGLGSSVRREVAFEDALVRHAPPFR